MNMQMYVRTAHNCVQLQRVSLCTTVVIAHVEQFF